MIAFLLVLFILLPSQALAFGFSASDSLFAIPLTDRSVVYLGQLFGPVGNVLQGNNFLLSHVFVLLNVAFWMFAGGVASYFALKSVVKTSMEGKVLGEQGNYWLAARTIAGVLALLPKFGGYSFIQVAVMWVVIQGIGLADQTLNAALNYLDNGGTFYKANNADQPAQTDSAGLMGDNTNQPAQIDSTGLTGDSTQKPLILEALTDAATMLNAAVCMYALQKQDVSRNQFQKLPPPPAFDSFSTKEGYIVFGDATNPEACGSYKLQDIAPQSAAVIKDAAVIQAAIELLPLARHILDNSNAIECTHCQETDYLLATAIEYANTVARAWPSPPAPSLQAVREDGWIMLGGHYNEILQYSDQTASRPGWQAQSPAVYGFQLPPRYAGIIFTGNDTAATIPNWNMLSFPPNLLSTAMINKSQQAFTNVRGYYQQGIQLANNLQAPTGESSSAIALRDEIQEMKETIFAQPMEGKILTTMFGFGGIIPPWKKPVTAFNVIDGDVHTLISDAITAWQETVLSLYVKPVSLINSELADYFQQSMKAAQSPQQSAYAQLFNPRDATDGPTADAIKPPTTTVAEIMSGANYHGIYIEPITRCRILGLRLIQAALTFWKNVTQHVFNMLAVSATTFTTFMIGAAILLGRFGLTSGVPGRNINVFLTTTIQMGSQIMLSHVFWYLPLGAAISTPMFIIGASLAAYIPLIPLIVFTFAALGWIISVLEAMVAAPLVAFGMTHPEGHDVLGKTEQALMLLFALFIRPACMVIGLLMGLVLVFLGTELFDMGYFDLALNVVADSRAVLSNLDGVDPTYTALVIMMILLTTYALILMAIVNQCMTAVYVLPDKIMRWIGVPPESSGVGAMVEATKSGAESKAGEGAQAGAAGGAEMKHSGIQPGSYQHRGKQGGGIKAEDK